MQHGAWKSNQTVNLAEGRLVGKAWSFEQGLLLSRKWDVTVEAGVPKSFSPFILIDFKLLLSSCDPFLCVSRMPQGVLTPTLGTTVPQIQCMEI